MESFYVLPKITAKRMILHCITIGSRVLDCIKAQADSSYQGISAFHQNSETPKKKPSGSNLTKDEKKGKLSYPT